MSKSLLTCATTAALALALATLGACDQGYQGDSAAHRNAQATRARVAQRAEHAARNLTAGVTAVAKGVEKGVREGVRQGNRAVSSQQAYNGYGERRDDHPQRQDRSPND